jgi:molecular chaperone GrpE (heat shock protein)
MTNSVMDSIFQRFNVVQFDPVGTKFDPNMMEAVYMINDPKQENNTVG